MYHFGLCKNFDEYDPNKELILRILDKHNQSYEDIFVFITDPAMITYSSIDHQSHQGTRHGLKKEFYSKGCIKKNVPFCFL